MRFEWDEQKNESNHAKHGIWFEEAETVFDDPLSEVFYDDDHSDNEERFVIIGFSSSSRNLVVIYCERDEDVIRIISARKATKHEWRIYER